MGSATGEYVTVPEPTSRIEEQARKAPSSYVVLRQNLFSELVCVLPVLKKEIENFLALLFYFHRN